MARSIDEIKREMTAEFMRQPAVRSAYGLDGSRGFAEYFSMASLESVIFYVFATAVWALEKLYDLHRAEVESRIEELEPHTLRWYVNKARGYMHGRKLVADCDYYDTSGMSDAEISAARVVRYAVATESNTVVYVKVARELDGNPAPLTPAQLAGLRSYMAEVKDAGVELVVRNEPADDIRVRLQVYYDPMLLTVDSTGAGVLADGSEPVREAVKGVIENLPFNGVLRKSDLMAAVQSLDCVEVVDFEGVDVRRHGAKDWELVEGYARPYSGYYSLELSVDYHPYNAVENDV